MEKLLTRKTEKTNKKKISIKPAKGLNQEKINLNIKGFN